LAINSLHQTAACLKMDMLV